jgi:hypothetical protein
VRSSISSSNIEVLRGDWRRTWALTLAVAAALLFLWEGVWRARGFNPMPADTPALWAKTRRDVRSDAVILIGSSRMAVGVDPKVFAEVTGIRPVQLSISGGSPVPVLKHFAEDADFKGTIICELSEDNILRDNFSPRALKYLEEYKNQSASERIEYRVNSLFQQHLVMALPEINPFQVLKSGLYGELPRPPYISIFPDRTSFADFTKADQQKLIANKQKTQVVGGRASQAMFLERASKLEEYVARIQGRGGKVIFVRMPISGVHWTNNEIIFPKRKFWDLFAAGTVATTIHFKDYPELDKFDCPDFAHLDRRDVPAFTIALARIIQERVFNR